MSIEFSAFDHTRDLQGQRDLFEDAFPEHWGLPAASVEHYRWKFQSYPSRPPSYEYCATDGERLVGYYAAIPYTYQIGDRQMSAGMVCDVMTHSDARGKGVFTSLGRFATREMETTELAFLIGYPVRPAVMGGHLRVGWEVAFELPMYLRPLSAHAVLASRGLGWLAPVASLGVAAYQKLLGPRSRDREFASTNGAPHGLLRAGEFGVFLGKWGAGIPNHLVKTREFYDWRLEAPATEYDAFMVYRGTEVVAVAVGRAADLHGVPSYALLDLMVLPDARGALVPLYQEIDEVARRHGAEAVVTMMSRRRAREHRLLRYGFLRSPFVFKLILRSVADQLSVEDISREQDWHLMWIDSDDM